MRGLHGFGHGGQDRSQFLRQSPGSFETSTVCLACGMWWIINQKNELFMRIFLQGRREERLSNDPVVFLVRGDQHREARGGPGVQGRQLLPSGLRVLPHPAEIPQASSLIHQTPIDEIAGDEYKDDPRCSDNVVSMTQGVMNSAEEFLAKQEGRQKRAPDGNRG